MEFFGFACLKTFWEINYNFGFYTIETHVLTVLLFLQFDVQTNSTKFILNHIDAHLKQFDMFVQAYLNTQEMSNLNGSSVCPIKVCLYGDDWYTLIPVLAFVLLMIMLFTYQQQARISCNNKYGNCFNATVMVEDWIMDDFEANYCRYCDCGQQDVTSWRLLNVSLEDDYCNLIIEWVCAQKQQKWNRNVIPDN